MEEIFRTNSINATLISGGIIFILTLASILIKQKSEIVSGLLFWSMVVVIVANTLFLSGSTLYLNSKSLSGGPVHWHADFEIWNCGQKVDIINPKGWSNKVGTPTFHEHNDNRMHVEGVITNFDEVSLGHFFEVIGGSLTYDTLIVPTDNGNTIMKSGENCNSAPGELQVFVYKTESDHTFSQTKLTDPKSYVLSHYSQVPPGDCIMIEFDSPKEKTERLCNFYKVAVQKGELRGN